MQSEKVKQSENKHPSHVNAQLIPASESKPAQAAGNDLFSSFASFAYSYIMTPAPRPTKSNKARIKTDYKDNVVASVALPERPKRKQRACHASTTHALSPPPGKMSSILSLFYHQPTPTSEKKDETIVTQIIRKPGKDDIDVKMKQLVARIKAMDQVNDKKAVEDCYLEQIDLVEHEIIEHAQRRVDLYFYLLVAVYQLGALVEKKSTHKQHGAGTNERGTNGAHDSFFPHVKLKYPKSKIATLLSVFVTQWHIRGTHFEDSNNMTSELPIMVNTFDTFMELATPGRQSGPSKYVKKCLDDLNLVSKGELTPIDGMNRFLKNMKLFFKEFEEKLGEAGKFDYPNVMRRIWELQYAGTLRAQSDDSDTIDHQYLCSLLRVPPAYILKTRQDPSLLLTYYCPIIQKEIFNTQSVIGEDRKIIKPQ